MGSRHPCSEHSRISLSLGTSPRRRPVAFPFPEPVGLRESRPVSYSSLRRSFLYSSYKHTEHSPMPPSICRHTVYRWVVGLVVHGRAHVKETVCRHLQGIRRHIVAARPSEDVVGARSRCGCCHAHRTERTASAAGCHTHLGGNPALEHRSRSRMSHRVRAGLRQAWLLWRDQVQVLHRGQRAEGSSGARRLAQPHAQCVMALVVQIPGHISWSVLAPEPSQTQQGSV